MGDMAQDYDMDITEEESEQLRRNAMSDRKMFTIKLIGTTPGVFSTIAIGVCCFKREGEEDVYGTVASIDHEAYMANCELYSKEEVEKRKKEDDTFEVSKVELQPGDNLLFQDPNRVAKEEKDESGSAEKGTESSEEDNS